MRQISRTVDRQIESHEKFGYKENLETIQINMEMEYFEMKLSFVQTFPFNHIILKQHILQFLLEIESERMLYAR